MIKYEKCRCGSCVIGRKLKRISKKYKFTKRENKIVFDDLFLYIEELGFEVFDRDQVLIKIKKNIDKNEYNDLQDVSNAINNCLKAVHHD